MTWFPKHKVVVPLDFSDESFAAVEVALELVRHASGVHVIHVLPEPHVLDSDVEWHMIDSENRRRRAEEAIRSRLSEKRFEQVQIEIDFGNPGYRIADYAQRIGADLIVTPSRGRSGLQRLMLGSVAERVVRLAHCPVLILRK